MSITVLDAAAVGIELPGAKGFIERDIAGRIACDAALMTSPNTGIPAELTTFLEPEVVEILTAPRNATEIFNEVRKGDWTTTSTKFRVEEFTGNVGPYSDNGAGPMSSANENWVSRPQYVFETSVRYGEREMAVSAEAKINLASVKQKSAAKAIQIAQNSYYLKGVAGVGIYGILNDPALPASISPATVSTKVTWVEKAELSNGANLIYADVLKLFSKLVKQSQGMISPKDRIILALPPDRMASLAVATEHGVTVMDMLKSYLSKLEVVILPELDTGSACTAYMTCPEVATMATASLAYGTKFQGQAIIQETSGYKQKFVASTYGGVVRVPFAIAQMAGI